MISYTVNSSISLCFLASSSLYIRSCSCAYKMWHSIKYVITPIKFTNTTLCLQKYIKLIKRKQRTENIKLPINKNVSKFLIMKVLYTLCTQRTARPMYSYLNNWPASSSSCWKRVYWSPYRCSWHACRQLVWAMSTVCVRTRNLSASARGLPRWRTADRRETVIYCTWQSHRIKMFSNILCVRLSMKQHTTPLAFTSDTSGNE